MRARKRRVACSTFVDLRLIEEGRTLTRGGGSVLTLLLVLLLLLLSSLDVLTLFDLHSNKSKSSVVEDLDEMDLLVETEYTIILVTFSRVCFI